MTGDDGYPARTGRSRSSRARGLALAVVVAALATFVAYAGWREVRKTTAASAPPAASHGFGDRRPALSADEERFAQALWNVHAEVRTAAVRMTFAGLAYKIGDGDAAGLRRKVTPLTETFRQAAADLQALPGPGSLDKIRGRYADAVRLYQEASRVMVRVADDGDDAHLLAAQQMSERASSLLLEVGERLWPGEIKPN